MFGQLFQRAFDVPHGFDIAQVCRRRRHPDIVFVFEFLEEGMSDLLVHRDPPGVAR
jgi:hypothetical protein